LDAQELLERYARRERDFEKAYLVGANLQRANLRDSNFVSACLQGANLQGANLERTDLEEANLHGARLEGVRLNEAHLERANLQGADLERARLQGANFEGAKLEGANLEGARLYEANLEGANFEGALLESAMLRCTHLVGLDLGPFCRARLLHNGNSTVDFSSIVKSVHCPHLKRFLRDTGMPQIFVDYMVDCARSLSPSERFTLMLSTFISYGGPDEEFARRLNKALKDNGVTTFFYPLDAELGQRNSSVMHRKIKEHDRVVLICSEASLTRPGVQTELTEVMDEEARRGSDTCLIPIRLDDYVLSKDFMPKNPDHRDLIVSRVVGDFRGADKDDSKFQEALPRLLDALRKKLEQAAASLDKSGG
jgi:hypothetical protein